MDDPRPNQVREQEARNLMIDQIAAEDAIRALESGQVNSFFVGGRTYSRSQLEELRRLRDSPRARAGQSAATPREYISYGIIGVVAGLVLGFIVANFVGPSGSAQQAATPGGVSKEASVNSSNGGQALPPGHPPIDTGQTIPAPPLPAGTPGASDSASSTSTAAAGQTTATAELPSLDPLAAGSKEERAEQKYKNIQLLKGIPSERLMKVMFAFKASLGVDCTYCHIKDQFEKDDKPTKQTARKMIQLVRDTNAKLGTATRVTCFTCHRGSTRPAS